MWFNGRARADHPVVGSNPITTLYFKIEDNKMDKVLKEILENGKIVLSKQKNGKHTLGITVKDINDKIIIKLFNSMGIKKIIVTKNFK